MGIVQPFCGASFLMGICHNGKNRVFPKVHTSMAHTQPSQILEAGFIWGPLESRLRWRGLLSGTKNISSPCAPMHNSSSCRCLKALTLHQNPTLTALSAFGCAVFLILSPSQLRELNIITLLEIMMPFAHSFTFLTSPVLKLVASLMFSWPFLCSPG